MSPTTVEKLEIDPLPRPAGAERLHPLIGAVEEHINRSILLLASGNPGSAPDFADWLDEKDLPGEDDLDKSSNKSVMIDRYTAREDSLTRLTTELDQKNRDIKNSAVEAFHTSNTTYKEITTIVDRLRAKLEDAPDPTKGEDGIYRLPVGVEFDLLVALLNAADQVHAEVEGAANAMDAPARQIDGSAPTIPRGYDYNNGGMPAATNAYRPPAASNASYRITDPNDPVGRALSVASGELGTRETDAAFAGKPYNNGSAWCAAFTSWVWKEAGYDVTWTDFDYVPAVWNDAEAMGLRRNSKAEAQPGDLIVFDWEGDGTPDHIGVVEAVSGGKIHTIEGNSSDQVAQRNYDINSGKVVGVIKPPPTGSDRV
ncbi:CHAP domain-containing protein [Nocardia rhamnosiphila]|uniref:CHAP domain-containing protein n=1 Tax=Nocardia rhamnosiphila TaxID=426716 RepID=A0ABV2WZV7_9NOCA